MMTNGFVMPSMVTPMMPFGMQGMPPPGMPMSPLNHMLANQSNIQSHPATTMPFAISNLVDETQQQQLSASMENKPMLSLLQEEQSPILESSSLSLHDEIQPSACLVDDYLRSPSPSVEGGSDCFYLPMLSRLTLND